MYHIWIFYLGFNCCNGTVLRFELDSHISSDLMFYIIKNLALKTFRQENELQQQRRIIDLLTERSTTYSQEITQLKEDLMELKNHINA